MSQLLMLLGSIVLIGITTAIIATMVVFCELDKIKQELSDEKLFIENTL